MEKSFYLGKLQLRRFTPGGHFYTVVEWPWHATYFASLLQKAVEAIIIILAFFELIFLLSLHAGSLGGDYGPAYANTASGAGHIGLQAEKHHHGIPAAAAV